MRANGNINGIFLFINHVKSLVGILSSLEKGQKTDYCVCVNVLSIVKLSCLANHSP